MLFEQVSERLVGELLKAAPAFLPKQVDRVQCLFIDWTRFPTISGIHNATDLVLTALLARELAHDRIVRALHLKFGIP